MLVECSHPVLCWFVNRLDFCFIKWPDSIWAGDIPYKTSVYSFYGKNVLELTFVNKDVFPILEIIPTIHPKVRVFEDLNVRDCTWPTKLM
jgi:hypothetical protein